MSLKVNRLKTDCFPIDFIKQLCLKLYPLRGIVYRLKMKNETNNNSGVLNVVKDIPFRAIAGPFSPHRQGVGISRVEDR
jgi:hypothetical protein